MADGPPAAARELCEEFAPRNGATRAREERGANRAFEIAAGGRCRRGKCVKNLLPGTEPQGLARSGEQTAPGKSRSPGLQPWNSRPEVRARKPKPGRRARTMPAAGPPPLKFPARGSRSETETRETSANHAGHRAHPTSPGPTQKRRAAARRFSLSSYLLILLSEYLFQRTQVDSLESFQVRFQQRKHF